MASTRSDSVATMAAPVQSVEGTVLHSYPLRKLQPQHTTIQHDTDRAFTLGDGPCGDVATRVMTVVLETKDSNDTRVVFFYDAWADRVCFLQRHYKLRLDGHGFVQLLYDVGSDETEERQLCVVVAERHVLRRARERLESRASHAFALPTGLEIALTFEEPRTLSDGDAQLRYEAPKHIYTRDVRVDGKRSLPIASAAAAVVLKPNKRIDTGERSLQQSTSTYKYTSLGDLVGGRASIYGVVVNMSLPKRSRGVDYSMTVDLVDESCPTRRNAIQIVIFYPTIQQMPKIRFVGDIIRFHRLDINRFKNNFQGVSVAKYSSYVVIRPIDQTGELEQTTCSETWTFDDTDVTRVHELLTWSKHMLSTDTSLLPAYPQPPVLLTHATNVPGAYVDVLVRVLCVHPATNASSSSSSNNRTHLVVWDGSCAVAATDAASTSDASARLQAADVDVPPHGVLRSIVFDSCYGLVEAFGFPLELTNHWCRFRNLHVETTDDVDDNSAAVLRFREGSSLIFVPPSVPDVQSRIQRIHAAAAAAARGKVPGAVDPTATSAAVPSDVHTDDEQSSPLAATTTSVEQTTLSNDALQSPPPSELPAQTQSPSSPVSIATIRTIVPAFIQSRVPVTSLLAMRNANTVPRKFHCVARVTQRWPRDLPKLTKPLTTSQSRNATGDAAQLTLVYSFVLRLEDATSAIDVIVYGNDANHFLQDIPPSDFHTNVSSRTVVEQQLTTLISQHQLQHWCIKSYYPQSAAVPTSSTSNSSSDSNNNTIAKKRVRYQLFDTRLAETHDM